MNRLHRPLRISLCVCLAGLVSSPGLTAQSSAPLWPSDPVGCIIRVQTPPTLTGDDPLSAPAWQQAAPLGPLFSAGQPEPSDRRTEIRLLLCRGTLYVGVQCGEPAPDTIRTATDPEEVWQADSIELLLTRTDTSAFPWLHVQIDAGGLLNLRRLMLPFGIWAAPLIEKPDPALVQTRTGRDAKGWWAVLALPLAECAVTGPPMRGNIVRNRQADRSHYAWVDLWGGRFLRAERFGRMVALPAPPGPPPRLRLPAALAVGINPLELTDWQQGCTLRANGKPLPVDAQGRTSLRIEHHGPTELELVRADGATLARYAAEVRRALIVSADEPFANDPTKPLPLHLTLNVVGGVSAAVTLEVVQGKKVVGRKDLALSAGTHALSVPLSDVQPGEVQILARAQVPAPPGEPVLLAARHWCVLGTDRDAFDRFRAGIEELPTRAMYRAGVADAAAFYRLIQDGNGEVRRAGRNRYGFTFWNQGFVYPLALAWKTDWPENPHRGDRRFLDAASLGMEAALEPERWQQMLDFPPNRNLQAWLLTYELLKDDVPSEQAEYWRRGLTRLVEAVVRCWVHPASFRDTCYSVDVGTGTNHYAYHASNVYTAGRIFGRDDWLSLGREMMRRLARHGKDGQFPERRDVPASRYTWLTMNALGQYYWQSRDETVRDALLRCADYSCHSSLPDGGPTVLHDGRVNSLGADHNGDFVLSLTPAGRALARVRGLTYIHSNRTPGRTGPERWFRAAETAVNFVPGDETPLPEDTEFTFLDGRGLIARRDGFVCGLSAISVPPIEGLFRLDPQNAVEWWHVRAGRILNGANSQQQPEAGSFFRKLKDRTVFLPDSGDVHRTLDGHVARLRFQTFETTLACRVLSPSAAEMRVEVVNMEGDEPVVFNFFPGVTANDPLQLAEDQRTIRFRNVTLSCSQPVKIERDFQILNPYNMQRRMRVKAVRAFAELELKKPLVLHITVNDTPR